MFKVVVTDGFGASSTMDRLPINRNAPSELHVTKAIFDVLSECARASAKFPAFSSRHEAAAVLLEEVDEFWDAIKKNDHSGAVAEAVQVAAMALRYLIELRGPLDE
jgi:hypothetical protein